MAKLLKLLALSAILGVASAIAFLGFEYIVNHGTDYIWNTLFDTDQTRWRVVPLAIGLSVIYSATLFVFGQKRVIEPHLDPLESKEDGSKKLPDIKDIAAIFIIGFTSLLAGASLGPEASLVAVCSGLGLWLAKKSGAKEGAKLLALCGVGALLVGFFGSLLPIALALLMMFQQQKKFSALMAVPVVCCLAAYGTLYLVGHSDGFGAIPAGDTSNLQDYLWAFILGAICTPIAVNLRRAVSFLYQRVKSATPKTHWTVSAGLFGAVLGLLYLIGGESVQFSGSVGTTQLLQNSTTYSLLALAGLLVVKLAVTAWSLAAGYRGGMVFPSIYIGVALALILHTALGGLPQTGLMIGSISGIFMAILGSPAVSLIMVASLLHLELLGLVVAGVAGATLSQKALKLVRSKNGL